MIKDHLLTIVGKNVIISRKNGVFMSYAVGDYFENFIKSQVTSGRFNNASEVVREGLRLVEEREIKLASLKNQIEKALANPDRYSEDEVLEYIENRLNSLDN